jgi:hypothetical protein
MDYCIDPGALALVQHQHQQQEKHQNQQDEDCFHSDDVNDNFKVT